MNEKRFKELVEAYMHLSKKTLAELLALKDIVKDEVTITTPSDEPLPVDPKWVGPVSVPTWPPFPQVTCKCKMDNESYSVGENSHTTCSCSEKPATPAISHEWRNKPKVRFVSTTTENTNGRVYDKKTMENALKEIQEETDALKNFYYEHKPKADKDE